MPTLQNHHESASAYLPLSSTQQTSRSINKGPSLKVALSVASILLVAILVVRSFATSSSSPVVLFISSGLLFSDPAISSTRSLSSTTTMEVGGSSKSSATGKHKLKDDVMSLYLNHASTGNSYYQLIPECLDPIQPLDFLDIGRKLGSQKVMGNFELEDCLQEDKTNCARSNQIKETCRTWSFYYDSIYNHWLQPKLARDDAEPFQAVEIGFFHGIGHEALSQFLPKAQVHSLEISCLPEGPREEGKWPWGNFAANSNQYDNLISKKRLHCGDAYSYDFLHSTFSQHIHLPDAPPLRVVVEDGSYQSQDMAASLFFWFPRLEPGGMFFVEGIRPDDNGGHGPADQFKTHIVPQVMKDLHWCGHSSTEEPQTDGGGVKDPDLCFPQLQPYLQGVHCEMHICVFVRNNRPAADPPKELSTVPPNAFENASKCLFGR